MKVAGFLKVRNEIIREGNLYRVLDQLERLCDGGVICDDASTDGTREYLREWVEARTEAGQRTVAGAPWVLMEIEPGKQDFRKEMHFKSWMLTCLKAQVRAVHDPWTWVLWMDGDELLDPVREHEFRPWLEQHGREADVWSFHYTQLWRSGNWARTDEGFDEGYFWKLWRWRDDLSFRDEGELHAAQFPQQYVADAVAAAYTPNGCSGRAKRAPFEIIHLGNYGKNLVWKAIQYRESGPLERASLARHLYFKNCKFRRVEALPGLVIEESAPMPFTPQETQLIEQMGTLRDRPGLFVVIVPTFNRGYALSRTLDSVRSQIHQNWVCVVLDDGSTDDTPQVVSAWTASDPRFFYCRYPTNRGGVAMNEIGMNLACEFGEFWVRLGSDDYFEPHKLELDRMAFAAFEAGTEIVYGPYRDLHETFVGNMADLSYPRDSRGMLLSGGFAVSWANIAVRTRLLKQVRERFGRFCDPQIRNMEDWLINTRLAYLAETTWRGLVSKGDGSAEVVIGARDLSEVTNDASKIFHDAVWRIGSDGASAKSEQIAHDAARTNACLAEDAEHFKPAPRAVRRQLARLSWPHAVPQNTQQRVASFPARPYVAPAADRTGPPRGVDEPEPPIFSRRQRELARERKKGMT